MDAPLDSGRIGRFVRMAANLAGKARHKQHRLGAVLIRGGNVISSGYNFGTTHAEHCVINRAGFTETIGTTLVIVRVRRNGTFGMSKPCDECVARLVNAGVKRVIYSDNNGDIQIIKLQAESAPPPTPQLRNILWHNR